MQNIRQNLIEEYWRLGLEVNSIKTWYLNVGSDTKNIKLNIKLK